MEKIYEENISKINSEIKIAQNDYIKYGKYAERCDKAFKFISIGHIVITGIYALGLIVPAMLSMSTLPFVTPFMCGLIGSCAVSVSLSAILGNFFEKKQEKASKRFDSLEHMKRKYNEKPYEDKKSSGKMVCKEIISDYNYSKDKNISLSLRK